MLYRYWSQISQCRECHPFPVMFSVPSSSNYRIAIPPNEGVGIGYNVRVMVRV